MAVVEQDGGRLNPSHYKLRSSCFDDSWPSSCSQEYLLWSVGLGGEAAAIDDEGQFTWYGALAITLSFLFSKKRWSEALLAIGTVWELLSEVEAAFKCWVTTTLELAAFVAKAMISFALSAEVSLKTNTFPA